MSEIVYILINEAMPGYVKIGLTTDLEGRIRSLDTTSVPLPFECFYAAAVANGAAVERQLHDAFLDHRVRSSREFFEIAPERVVSALRLAEIANVTPGQDFVESQEDQTALNEARERRAVFNFKVADIPVGSQLTFFDRPDIVGTVLDNRRIMVDGEETSLSKSARAIMGYSYPVAGTDYWMYEGETLDQRRRRIENED